MTCSSSKINKQNHVNTGLSILARIIAKEYLHTLTSEIQLKPTTKEEKAS